MNKVRIVAKNIFATVLSDLTTKILSFILTIYIARMLGVINFGIYTFAFSFAGLFLILSDPGLNTLFVRDVSRNKEKGGIYLGNLFYIKLILAMLTVALVFIIINILGYPSLTISVVYIVCLSLVIGAISALFQSVFNAFEKMEYTTLTVVAEKILVFSLSLYVLWNGYGIIELVSVLLVGSIFSLILSSILVSQKFTRISFKVDFQLWRYLLTESLPLAASWIFISVYFYIGSVLLSKIQGDAAVGIYNAAYNLLSALIFIPSTFIVAVFPTLSALHKSSQDSFKFAYEKSWKYLFTLTFPIVIGTELVASNIIYFIYGNEFSEAIITLKILILAFLFIPGSALMNTLLTSIDRQHILAKVTAIGAITNIALNLILIPRYSYIGAGAATVVTELIIFSLYLRYMSKYSYSILMKRIIIRPVIASVIMAFFVFALLQYNINVFATILLAAMVYLTSFYLIGGVMEEDRELLKLIFKKQ